MQTINRNLLLFTAFVTIVIVFGAVSDIFNNTVTVPAGTALDNTATASLSLISPIGQTIEIGLPVKVTWSSSDYGEKTVNVHLMRKVSDNPIAYDLVRTIAVNKANTGSATWIPNQNDIGFNVALEVGCAPSGQACIAGNNISAPLAVVNTGRSSNTASAFEALEGLMNR